MPAGAAHRILVLGAGRIGAAVAADLSREGRFAVTVADTSLVRLAPLGALPRIHTEQADLSRADVVRRLAASHDLAIGALPSVLGYEALRAVLGSARPAVDISFMAEDALALDALARDAGVSAVVDCGVAPGLSHMMVADAARRLSRCDRVRIYVGGLPAERRGPFEYKAGFSPYDVIEEYVRPARIVEDGRVIEADALSGVETIHVPGIGTLEAFLTDGLRTLVRSVEARSMTEKTLRYPGHAALMRAFRDAGFFSREPIVVEGCPLRPLDVTAALLFPQWAFEEGEADLTVLRVVVAGVDGEAPRSFTWDLLDRYDPQTRLRSMSRTTAFPAVIVAGLVLDGAFPPGVHPPEAVGRMGLLDRVLRELAARGVRCEAGA